MTACLAASKFSFTDPSVLIAIGSLAGVLLVAAAIFALLDRWRKRQANETFSTHDQLTSFRELYEEGELSHGEYERIRQQLLGRLKANDPPKAASTPATEVIKDATEEKEED